MRQKNKLFKRKCLQAAQTEPSLIIRETVRSRNGRSYTR